MFDIRFLVVLFDSSISESDIMINEGFQKIYDCGNAVYEWRTEN